jgi:hypothetical protein
MLGTLGLTTLPANAQATRTWVSGVGDDANPCSRTAPCKTFAGAISKTAENGEISVLDPGGFGAVTITKGIVIDGDGTLAGILAAGTNGIIINAAATKDVTIRNVSINGGGSSTAPGLNGIRFLAGGSLTLQNVSIYNFSQSCLDIAITAAGGPITHVVNSNFSSCTTGISVSNTVAGQRSSVNVNNSKISDVVTGINAVRQSNISLDNVTVAGATSVGISINSPAGTAASEVNMHSGTITMDVLGVGIGSGSTGRFDDVYFSANVKAMDNQGTCQTAGNNSLGGNLNGSTGAACSPISKF